MESTLAATSVLEPSPAKSTSVDVMVAISHDGGRALVTDGEVVRFADGRALMRGARACALALVEGEAWIVVEDAGQHALRRFDAAGDPLEPALRLGPLGGDVRITATRIGVRSALIEGDRAVYVREQAVEELGARGRARRVLLGGRGVAERRGGALVLRRAGAIALPGDLAAAAIVGGAMVLDGGAALLELERAGCRTAIVLDLRRGAVHSRLRLGEAAILAVAERTGLVVLGRGAHVALCDLRAGRCTGERILPAPVRACAIDADGTRLLVLDAAGKLHALAASMADWTAPAARPDEAGPAPESGEPAGRPACDERDEHAEAMARDDLEPHRSEVAADGGREPTSDALDPDLGGNTDRAAPAPDPLVAAQGLDLIALGPAADRALAADELEAYLADARAWVVALCRTALAAGLDAGRLGRADPAELDGALGDRPGRAAAALARAREVEGDATERFSRWDRRGAPHIELARELELSPLATSLLLLTAAPQIWGELARGYGLCVADRARPLVDEHRSTRDRGSPPRWERLAAAPDEARLLAISLSRNAGFVD
jgi:hypothetical protein